MRNTVAKALRVSALVAAGGALSLVVLSSNCGGSSGQRTGAAGGTGTAGVTGSGGSGGKFACTPKPDLTCGSSAIRLSDGHITDFSMREWTSSSGKWCDATGLQGSIFSYSGGPAPVDGGLASANDRGVDAPNENFRLTLTAA